MAFADAGGADRPRSARLPRVARTGPPLWRKLERWFEFWAKRLTLRRLGALRDAVDRVLRNRAVPGDLVVPGGDLHFNLVGNLTLTAWRWGAAHARDELAQETRRKFNDPELPQPAGPTPADAVAWMRGRQELAGKWNRDLDEQVKAVLARSLEVGATNRDVMRELAKVFPEFGKSRLENIARTETMAAYNQGRVAMFREGGVAAVQFAAILDDRTTTICRARDGLIMELDDPRLAGNTPPLHFQCRSVLVPITRSTWKWLQRGDARLEKRHFGWLGPGGPRNLEEALRRWNETPAPLSGFGGPESPQPAPGTGSPAGPAPTPPSGPPASGPPDREPPAPPVTPPPGEPPGPPSPSEAAVEPEERRTPWARGEKPKTRRIDLLTPEEGEEELRQIQAFDTFDGRRAVVSERTWSHLEKEHVAVHIDERLSWVPAVNSLLQRPYGILRGRDEIGPKSYYFGRFAPSGQSAEWFLAVTRAVDDLHDGLETWFTMVDGLSYIYRQEKFLLYSTRI